MRRRSFPVLFRKELREQTRSYHLLVVGLLFVFFGLASPLLARFTPEIVKMAGVGQNIVIELPEPTAADAVAQYVKNLSQIALFVLIFLTMGAVVVEKERGTAVFVLVKPASRLGFLAAKLTVSWATVMGAVVLSGLCAYGYTAALFEPPSTAGFVLANVALLLHLLTFVTTTFFFSALARSQAVAGVLSFLAWVLLASLGGLGYVTEFLPGRLLSAAMASAAGVPLPWEPLVGCAAIIAFSFFGAVLAFRHWEP
jgi:ABC-2 type transport system permease protein